jgi:Domain of unknown function (DUF6896)
MDLTTPWHGWVAVCLCRQLARQRWLVGVARSRLRDVGEEEGSVPGLPQWRYHYHGIGLCLSGPGNEVIDVDFNEEDGETVDPYFFARRVLGLAEPGFVEARMRHWLPSAELVVAVLDELRVSGAIAHPTSGHVFRLGEELMALDREVSSADLSSVEVQRTWARRFRDDEEAGAGHRRWLSSLAARDERRARVVVALLPPGDAVALGEAILEGPVRHATGAVVEALDDRGLTCEGIGDMLERLDPASQHPYIAWAIARHLLRRGDVRAIEAVCAFANVRKVEGYNGNPYDAELAMLLLEYAPGRAMPYVRLALRSDTPAAVHAMAALVAAIGQPWCWRELDAALADTKTKEVPWAKGNARRLAAALGKVMPPPERKPGQIGFSHEEVVAANLDGWLSAELERVAPLADKLRALLPDNFHNAN